MPHLQLLRDVFGYQAFRGPQQAIIEHVIAGGDALVLIGDKPTSIPMTSAGGDVFGQFLTKMTFEDLASEAMVTVSIEPGKPLEGGQRVGSGNIQFRNAEGWETVLPVTGVRACIPG